VCVPAATQPLREPREDIPPLVFYFAQRFAKRLRRLIESVSRESLDLLCRWPWPGNIRELQNVIERAVILSRGGRLRLDVALPRAPGAALFADSPSDLVSDDVILTDRECRDRERKNLMKALERADGRIYGQGGAAELLGVNPTTLASRLRALKIKTNKAP
jgi:transcriptional regulator with GAF, ATPase, and Fis domain